MSSKSKDEIETNVDAVHTYHDRHRNDDSLRHIDNDRLAELGYKPEFKREFSVRLLSRYFALLTAEHVDDRSHRVQFLHNGSSCLRDFYILLSPPLRWSCRHGLWMVDPQFVCVDRCCLHGRDGIIHAVSLSTTVLHGVILMSSYSTSAGLYYFAAKLAPPKHAALASWITGWANVTGQVGIHKLWIGIVLIKTISRLRLYAQ